MFKQLNTIYILIYETDVLLHHTALTLFNAAWSSFRVVDEKQKRIGGVTQGRNSTYLNNFSICILEVFTSAFRPINIVLLQQTFRELQIGRKFSNMWVPFWFMVNL